MITLEHIDELVRNGTIGSLMLGQFPTVYPRTYADLDDNQRLGIDYSAIITSADDLLDNDIGATVLPQGGPGGTIILREEYADIDAIIKHEGNHSGASAVDLFADYFRATNNNFRDSQDGRTVEEALSITSSESGQIDPEDCPSCDPLSTANRHLSTFEELRAYRSEGDNLRRYQRLLEMDGVDSTSAGRITNDLLADRVLNEQIDTFNQSARILSDLARDEFGNR